MSDLTPGALRQRLTLEELQRTSDEGGGFSEVWVTVATVFAVLRPTGGGERVESGRLAGTVTHEAVLRYRPGVEPAMRFRQGARIFQILAVIDVEERRRWLKCLCEERDLIVTGSSDYHGLGKPNQPGEHTNGPAGAARPASGRLPAYRRRARPAA